MAELNEDGTLFQHRCISKKPPKLLKGFLAYSHPEINHPAEHDIKHCPLMCTKTVYEIFVCRTETSVDKVNRRVVTWMRLL